MAGTIPLYRLFHAAAGDHMDSTSPTEGGYQNEGPLGFPFSSPSVGQGLQQVLRTFNTCNGDHGTRSKHEPPRPCERDEPMAGYAWPRFLNQNTSMLELAGGGVTFRSNRVAGGAGFHWVHRNASGVAVQYVNNRDFGRQMQSAVFFTRDGRTVNPTEGGDRYSDYTRPGWARHGSPLQRTATNLSTLTQTTRSVPLEWEPEKYGGDADHPVVYKDMALGKDITLNWGGLGPVARYSTSFTSPALANATIEIPTAYLRAEFDRYYTYDAVGNVRTQVFPGVNCPDTYNYTHYAPPSMGGVIIANAARTRAMGVYGASTSVGGSISEILLGKFIGGDCGSGTGEFDAATSKFSVLRKGSMLAGTKTYNTWVMTGSLDDVTRYMKQLADWGSK
jgi:hypothetical protein